MSRAGRSARLVGAALLTGTLLSACTPPGAAKKKNDLDAAPPKTTVISVRTVTATPGVLEVQRTAAATIRAERDSRVAAQSSGVVGRVLAREGEQVVAGAGVLQLDDTAQRQALETARLQLRQAQISLEQARTTRAQSGGALQSAVTSAEAALAQAQQNAASAEKLYALGGVSLADVQAARSALAQAQSSLAQARQNLVQNGRSAQNSIPLQQVQVQSAQVAVAQAQENLSRTVIRAPFAGTVALLLLQEGEFAAQGAAAFRLVDPGSVRVKFSVPASDAGALEDGATFNLGYGGRNYVARVVDSAGIAGSDRLVPVTARVEGGAALPVGAAAQARYRVVLGRGVLLPSSAVQADTDGNSVYRLDGGRARRQQVSLVAESAGRVAVAGLEPGAAVIQPVPASLQDGAPVKVTGAAP
ncbi:efflux RND transporter periplasmic adaptor subunit [Deinococcus hohokamensis]|uniref:Efflux RND transporter periplasmic adaptor subunit n=1 Tax=Deinococcus hohokamensis TaxID=309883 RepID=A0ABV9I9Z7_9DEIO